MVVNDLDLVRMIILPSKANPPLIVDADGMLPCAVAPQCFEPIAGRNVQIVEALGIVKKTQFS